MDEYATDFAELMGMMFQVDGGARNAGRLFGYLLIVNKPVKLQDLAERLQISKASASTNARYLVEHGLVEVLSKPGQRSDFYRILDNPYPSMVATLARGMERKTKVLTSAVEKLPPEMCGARQRVQDLADFYQASVSLFDAWARTIPSNK